MAFLQRSLINLCGVSTGN